jgi:glycerophosphoryl diester phosphodiesterase
VHPYFAAPLPHLFAHRGASGLAPENTLAAFDLALESGVAFLETDCHATRDGELVLCHDAAVASTTDGEGTVAELSYAQLSRLDAGYRFSPAAGGFPFRGRGLRVPRLAEVLERYPRARLNVELKGSDPALAEPAVALVRKLGASERVLLAAESHPVLEAVRALRPGTALGSSLADVVEFFRALDSGSLAEHRPRGHALQIPARVQDRELVTPEVIAAAERLGLFVHVWTIDEPAEMDALLARGAHGLMSNFPERLRQAAERRLR